MATVRTALLYLIVVGLETDAGLVNIAKNKKSTASSLLWNWEAHKAVDGNSDITGEQTTCFHAARGPSSWRVDLGSCYQIFNIKVYLRNKFEYRTANSRMFVDDDDTRTCYYFPSDIQVNPVEATCNTTARYVTIFNPGTVGGHEDALNICEVEIYVCSAGSYGQLCDEDCHCSVCDRWTGVCAGSCTPGWTGQRCDQACNTTSYGINCEESCLDRNCAGTSTCDRFTGLCESGCRSGWIGVDCTQVCDNGNYGQNCSELCTNRNCAGVSSCHHVTGSCDQGCQDGWIGVDCRQACDSEHYGANCTKPCSSRHCEGVSSCSPSTGGCDGGCLTGWAGEDCTVCDSEHYGSSCTKLCSSRHCEGESSCSPTGGCDGGCQTGWAEVDCTACDVDNYGVRCSDRCSNRHCAGESSCHNVTGSCDLGCSPGWQNTDCTEICDGEYYGANCTSVCDARHCEGNSTCTHITGECVGGCQAGWEGLDCTVVVQLSPSPLSAYPGVVAGAAVAAVVVLLATLVVVLVLVRRRRTKREDHTSSDNLTCESNQEKLKPEANVYMNVGVEDNRHEETDHVSHTASKPVVVVQLNKHVGDGTKSVGMADDGSEEKRDEVEAGDNSDMNYYNLTEVRDDHVIAVSELERRVREMENKPEIYLDEFQRHPDGFIHSYNDSQKLENKTKNRFKGYYPYDYNRVVLHDVTGGDYINASYVDGYNSKRSYIAAQGPYKTGIVEDFWRMIWQEGCLFVVMLTGLVEGGKMKCTQYWPESGTEKYGDITVVKETETKTADFVITTLSVQRDKKTRKLYHFNLTSWPDHGVPDTSTLLSFMWRIHSVSRNHHPPVLVHCSAGIGRTGTFIAVESLLKQADEEGVVDVVGFVSNMRAQRKGMIQTKEQYQFIYHALVEAVVNGNTSLDADFIRKLNLKTVDSVTMGNKTVKQHLQTLQQIQVTTKEFTIRVPSYRSRLGFIIMSADPDRETLWNQLYDSGARTIVTWSSDNMLSVQSSLPLSPDTEISTSRFTISSQASSHVTGVATTYIMEMKTNDVAATTILRHYHVTGSLHDAAATELIDNMIHWTSQRDQDSVLIVSNSLREVRLLILLVNIASRLQDDGKVDVISDMRRVQERLGGETFNEKDVRVCLEFAQRYLASQETYANL